MENKLLGEHGESGHWGGRPESALLFCPGSLSRLPGANSKVLVPGERP